MPIAFYIKGLPYNSLNVYKVATSSYFVATHSKSQTARQEQNKHKWNKQISTIKRKNFKYVGLVKLGEKLK